MTTNEDNENYNVAIKQPDEVNALKAVVKEFITKVKNVENEIELLKQDRKDLIEEYKEKLDLKTLTAALRVLKIQNAVEHKDTFDLFLSVLEDEE